MNETRENSISSGPRIMTAAMTRAGNKRNVNVLTVHGRGNGVANTNPVVRERPVFVHGFDLRDFRADRFALQNRLLFSFGEQRYFVVHVLQHDEHGRLGRQLLSPVVLRSATRKRRHHSRLEHISRKPTARPPLTRRLFSHNPSLPPTPIRLPDRIQRYLHANRQIVLLDRLVVQRMVDLYVRPRETVVRPLLQVERVELVGLGRRSGHQPIKHRRVPLDARAENTQTVERVNNTRARRNILSCSFGRFVHGKAKMMYTRLNGIFRTQTSAVEYLTLHACYIGPFVDNDYPISNLKTFSTRYVGCRSYMRKSYARQFVVGTSRARKYISSKSRTSEN